MAAVQPAAPEPIMTTLASILDMHFSLSSVATPRFRGRQRVALTTYVGALPELCKKRKPNSMPENLRVMKTKPVARMERVIRDRLTPDYAEFTIWPAGGRTRWLHPGYEAAAQ